MKFDLVNIYETYDNLKGMWKASKEQPVDYFADHIRTKYR